MKTYLNYILSFGLFICLAACEDNFEKAEVKQAEALTEADQSFPANNSSLALNAGTPEEQVVISWLPAKSGLGSTVVYRVLFDTKEGDFSTPLAQITSDNEGKATQLTLTHQQLNEVVKNAGTEEFAWKVESTVINPSLANANSTVTSLAYLLNIKPFGTGIPKFAYLQPTVNQKLLLDKINAPNGMVVFDWEDAVSTTNDAVTYTFLAGTTDDFTEPVITVASDEEGTGSQKSFTNTEFIELLGSIDYIDGLFWRVEAKTGDFTYTPETRFVWFEIFDVPTLFVLGDATTAGWNNNETDPVELNKVGDGKFTGLVSLMGGKEMKFIMTRGSWDTNWGSEDLGGQAIVSGTAYTLQPGGPNIKVPQDGNYTIDVNFIEGTFKLTLFNPPAALHLVGGSTAAGWNPENAIPFKKISEGKFELFTYLTVSDGMKFLPGKTWDGDWGKKPGAEGSLLQDGEENVKVSTDGFYRVLVEFATQSYTVAPMSWGIIGDATAGGWDKADTNMTSPTQKGDYTWTITTDLTAGEFKFRADDSWDINLGDNGADNSLENGGTNIKVSTAGNYTITLVLDPLSGYTYSMVLN